MSYEISAKGWEGSGNSRVKLLDVTYLLKKGVEDQGQGNRGEGKVFIPYHLKCINFFKKKRLSS